MLIFIDESGDTGLRISKGSSLYFIVVLIIFEDGLDAEETALKIKRLRQSLGKSDQFEFKFSKSNRYFRETFLNTVKDCNFRIRAVVFDKGDIAEFEHRDYKNDFYSFALRELIEKNKDTIHNAKIRIDGRGERVFRDRMVEYLRHYLNTETGRAIKNLKFRDSKKDVLIQLADMVAGSLMKSFSKRTSDWDYYRNILREKEEYVWEFTRFDPAPIPTENFSKMETPPYGDNSDSGSL